MAASAHHPSTLALLVIVPLLVWRIYARMRRMVGRQRFRPVRLWLQLVLFSLLVLLLAAFTLTHPERLAVLVAGVAAGVLLARLGLRKTRFEPTPAGLYYTPDARLGMALTLLFAARVVYRLVEVFVLDTALPGSADFARSPLTLTVFGLLAGYYVSDAIGLLRWRAGLLRRQRQSAADTALARLAAPGDGPPPG